MHTVKHLVGRVMRARYFNERNGLGLKHDDLPGAAGLVALVGDHCPVGLVKRGLDAIAVGAIVTVPQEQTHGADYIRLSELYADAATAQLVACVARVPVVVFVVAVD